MSKEDRRYLAMFILLILLLIVLLIYDSYRNRKLNVDRKVELIFDTFSYDTVYDTGKELFLNAIKISNSNNLEVARDNSNRVEYYAFAEYSNYKKIIDFNIVSDTLSSKNTQKYIKDKNIVLHNNHYYIMNNQDKSNADYIGSNLEIKSYDDNFVYFQSINYYCEDSEYIGIIEKNPDCTYETNTTEFTLIKENNNLRINDYESIAKIIE